MAKFDFDEKKLQEISDVCNIVNNITSDDIIESVKYVIIKEFLDKEFPGLSTSEIKQIIYEHSPEKLV